MTADPDPKPPRTSDIYGILVHPFAPRVLLLEQESGIWTLPHIHLPDSRLFFPLVELPNKQLGDLLAAEVTALRTVYSHYTEDHNHVDLIYSLENHSPNWLPPMPSRWANREELAAIALAFPAHRAVIEAELAEAETQDIPALRPLWARHDWFTEAAAWMRDQLARHGYNLIGRIEQIKSWGISCLLRADTDQGKVYFKVSTPLPLFGDEPQVTRALATRYPAYVPLPLEIEPTRRWLLLRDFGTELRQHNNVETWAAAVGRFAKLQRQTATAIDELLALGCLDRRLEVLAAQIDPLLTDDEALNGLSAGEIAQLRTLAPRLKQLCQQAASYGVPATLTHGDLHSGNITAESLLFFDWTDACIAHPFFDLSTLIEEAESLPDGRNRLLAAYLPQWTKYEPEKRLRELWAIVEPLGALHQAVSYQHILATMEPTSKQEFDWSIPFWLRRMIKTLPE
ncbi:MAG: phosphotransferase [Anaerolineae bacterium]|nr:phosphotransferase [Anaerolineae bacterium]